MGPDGELRVFLNGLAEATDVPTYVKDHRIGDPPITNSHPDWAYYSKVIRSANGSRYQCIQSTPKLPPKYQKTHIQQWQPKIQS
nr:uncharacterized FCP1 homology domain-containing protein C1271.03c-like [Tanacetum cinerariifolium]